MLTLNMLTLLALQFPPGPWALLGPMLTLNMLTLLALQFPVKGLTAYITQVSCSYYV